MATNKECSLVWIRLHYVNDRRKRVWQCAAPKTPALLAHACMFPSHEGPMTEKARQLGMCKFSVAADIL